MNKDEELKFPNIKKGKMITSKMPQGTYVAFVEKKENLSSDRKNNINKKTKKVLKKILAAICVYLVLNGLISTAAVQDQYGVNWDNSVRHGTDLVLSQEEKDKIPYGAYLDRMIENLNPVNLIDDAIDTARSRR